MLKSYITSATFLSLSVRYTTYFISSFLLTFTLIITASSGYKRDVCSHHVFGRKIRLICLMLECFRVPRCVIKKEYNLSTYNNLLWSSNLKKTYIILSSYPNLVVWEEMHHTWFSFILYTLKTSCGLFFSNLQRVLVLLNHLLLQKVLL